jgi:hypothetical protein
MAPGIYSSYLIYWPLPEASMADALLIFFSSGTYLNLKGKYGINMKEKS